MYFTLFHPELGARKFEKCDYDALKGNGWYETPDDYPVQVVYPPDSPTQNLPVDPPKRRGRKPK